MDKQVEKLMKALDITEAEALEVIETDKAIDKGADPFPLTQEQKKAVRKATQADRKPTVYNFSKRERKADEDKATLVNALFTAILPMCETYEVVNSEREFLFTYNGKKYKVVLSTPRS